MEAVEDEVFAPFCKGLGLRNIREVRARPPSLPPSLPTHVVNSLPSHSPFAFVSTRSGS